MQVESSWRSWDSLFSAAALDRSGRAPCGGWEESELRRKAIKIILGLSKNQCDVERAAMLTTLRSTETVSVGGRKLETRAENPSKARAKHEHADPRPEGDL